MTSRGMEEDGPAENGREMEGDVNKKTNTVECLT
jgi:hypothetical protein